MCKHGAVNIKDLSSFKNRYMRLEIDNICRN